MIKKRLNIKFILAGRVDPDSPSAINISYLRNLNNKNNKNFKWIGFQKNIKKIINSSDVVVLPSYHEGAPKVLLEVAACGKFQLLQVILMVVEKLLKIIIMVF